MNIDILKSKFVKSIFWLGSAKLLAQATSWLTTIFLVRLLAPQDFGIIAMVSAYEAIIIITYDLNLGAALVQKKDLDQITIHTAFWFILGFSILLYLLTVVLAPYVALFFKTKEVVKVLRVYAIGSVFQSIQQVPYWLMAKRLDFDKQAKALFAANMISLGISLTLAFLGYGVWSLVLGFLAKNFFQAIFICLLFEWGDFFSWNHIFSFSWPKLFSLLNFSAPLTGFYFLRYIYMRSDTIVVGRILGDELLGYYSVALDLARMPVDKFVTIINQVCFPAFSELQSDLKALRYFFLKTIKFISLIVFPVSIGAALLSKEMVYLILTPKWQPIIKPFICLCFVAILQSLAGVMFMVMNAIGKSQVNFRFSLISAIILPISFIIGVQYSLIGIALSWMAVYPLLFLYLLYRTDVDIHVGLIEFMNAMKLPFQSSIFMLFAVLAVKLLCGFGKVSLGTFLSYIFIGAITYIGCICLFSPGTIYEIKSIYLELRAGKAPSAILSN